MLITMDLHFQIKRIIAQDSEVNNFGEVPISDFVFRDRVLGLGLGKITGMHWICHRTSKLAARAHQTRTWPAE